MCILHRAEKFPIHSDRLGQTIEDRTLGLRVVPLAPVQWSGRGLVYQ